MPIRCPSFVPDPNDPMNHLATSITMMIIKGERDALKQKLDAVKQRDIDIFSFKFVMFSYFSLKILFFRFLG